MPLATTQLPSGFAWVVVYDINGIPHEVVTWVGYQEGLTETQSQFEQQILTLQAWLTAHPAAATGISGSGGVTAIVAVFIAVGAVLAVVGSVFLILAKKEARKNR